MFNVIRPAIFGDRVFCPFCGGEGGCIWPPLQSYSLRQSTQSGFLQICRAFLLKHRDTIMTGANKSELLNWYQEMWIFSLHRSGKHWDYERNMFDSSYPKKTLEISAYGCTYDILFQMSSEMWRKFQMKSKCQQSGKKNCLECQHELKHREKGLCPRLIVVKDMIIGNVKANKHVTLCFPKKIYV